MKKFLLLFSAFLGLIGMTRAPETPSIGVTTLELYDQDRSRPIQVELWYPTVPWTKGVRKPSVWVHPRESRDALYLMEEGSRPLILMSHGHAGDRRNQSWLAEALVREGYIVASVEHHGDTWKTLNPVSTLRFWDRPRDVTFALDHILQHPEWSSRIDPDRIGFTGYSFGGMTGLALAGGRVHQLEQLLEQQKGNWKELEQVGQVNFEEAKRSFHDSRIRSFLLIAPATWGYDPHEIKTVGSPIAIIAPSDDEIIPTQEHAIRLIEGGLPVRHKIFDSPVAHNSFINRVSDLGKEKLHPYYVYDRPGFDRAAFHKEVSEFSLSFFEESLSTRTE